MLRQGQARGFREVGSGRKDHLKELKEQTKAWAIVEMSCGRVVDRDDLFFEFTLLVRQELIDTERRITQEGTLQGDLHRLKLLHDCLEKLTHPSYLKMFKLQLMVFCDLWEASHSRLPS